MLHNHPPEIGQRSNIVCFVTQRISLRFRLGPNDEENGNWTVFPMRVSRLFRWDLLPIKTLPQTRNTHTEKQEKKTTRRQKVRQARGQAKGQREGEAENGEKKHPEHTRKHYTNKSKHLQQRDTVTYTYDSNWN